MSTLRVLIIALVLAMLGALGSPANGAWPGRNGRVAYPMDPDGYEDSAGWDLYSFDKTGRDRRRLTHSPSRENAAGMEFNPAYSPNGKRIVFEVKVGPTANASRNWDIIRIDHDGTNRTNLTSSLQTDFYPDWSPNGRKIIWARETSHDGLEIFKMNADGSNKERVTDMPGGLLDVGWSPDGDRIAYIRRSEGSHWLFTANPNGSNEERVIRAYRFDWAPSGDKFVVESPGGPGDNERVEIHTLRENGQRVRQVANWDHEVPVWSPSGKRILLKKGSCELVTVAADGSDRQAFHEPDGCSLISPTWGPKI